MTIDVYTHITTISLNMYVHATVNPKTNNPQAKSPQLKRCRPLLKIKYTPANSRACHIIVRFVPTIVILCYAIV